MIRSVLLGLTISLLSSPLAAVELVVYNWPYYLAPEVKARFTQETGNTIKELYYDNEEARNTLLMGWSPLPKMASVVPKWRMKIPTDPERRP